MKRYELFVFDWDGTLMDSTGLIAQCVQWASADLGLPIPTQVQAKHIIGLGLAAATEILFPDLGEADRQRFVAQFRHHYLQRDHEAPLYAGVPDMLAAIKRVDNFLAVATGKPRTGLERAFDASGLRHHFEYSRCADEGFPKPHPDMLLQLMKFTGVAPDKVVMIGDTTHDLQLAGNAGVDAVSVTYGAHPPDELERLQPLATLNTVEELHAWLIRHA